MPEIAEIQRSLIGSWRMMIGKPDGLKLLDISADGFWNSFFAIAVALPPLFAGWMTIVGAVAPTHAFMGGKLSVLLRLATVDVGSWVLPLAAFAAAARPTGLADRFAHYVISTNWGSALIAWMMLPPTLVRLFYPPADEIASAVSLCLFIVSMVFIWRLTNSALGRGAGMATAVFGAMFVISLAVFYLLQSVLGLGALEPATG